MKKASALLFICGIIMFFVSVLGIGLGLAMDETIDGWVHNLFTIDPASFAKSLVLVVIGVLCYKLFKDY